MIRWWRCQACGVKWRGQPECWSCDGPGTASYEPHIARSDPPPDPAPGALPPAEPPQPGVPTMNLLETDVTW